MEEEEEGGVLGGSPVVAGRTELCLIDCTEEGKFESSDEVHGISLFLAEVDLIKVHDDETLLGHR